MKEIITVLELISRIKNTRSEMDSLYNIYINPSTRSESRSMVSLYNKSTMYTINGKPADEIAKEIKDIDFMIKDSFKKLQKLLIIKEQINANCMLTIKSPFDGSDIELSVAQILVLKSDSISKYNKEYLDKLEEDYQYGNKMLGEQQRSALSNDKIDNYVIAKMKSLNIASESNDTYSKFAEEYRIANKLEILDPLNIKDNIKKSKKFMNDFYNSISIKLMEFNATKKIWIDLSLDNDFWGFIE